MYMFKTYVYMWVGGGACWMGVIVAGGKCVAYEPKGSINKMSWA